MLPTVAPKSIENVRLRPLSPIPDVRGSLCEIYREGWDLAPRSVQWDLIATRACALRGVHVHQIRFDYFVVVSGRATIGLSDLRRDSGSFRRSMMIEFSGETPTVVVVPPGVAHGIYAHTELTYLYGLTAPWDGGDGDLGCRYDDPEMGIAWPFADCILLPRDANLTDFETLIRQFEKAGGVRSEPFNP